MPSNLDGSTKVSTRKTSVPYFSCQSAGTAASSAPSAMEGRFPQPCAPFRTQNRLMHIRTSSRWSLRSSFDQPIHSSRSQMCLLAEQKAASAASSPSA